MRIFTWLLTAFYTRIRILLYAESLHSVTFLYILKGYKVNMFNDFVNKTMLLCVCHVN